MKIPINRVIAITAYILLGAAYIFGIISNSSQLDQQLKENISSHVQIKVLQKDPFVYSYFDEKNMENGYITITREQGWGGPLHVATWINSDGKIVDITVLSHVETFSFFKRLLDNRFFEQFTGIEVSSYLSIEKDVHAVSGATISSRAFTAAVREGSHLAGTKYLDMNVNEIPVEWSIGYNELIIIILFSMVLYGVWFKASWMRYVTMACGLIFIGFYINFPVSISNLSSLVLGFVPLPQKYLFWWLLMLGVLLLIAITGRNLYCTWLCPFGAMQEFLSRVSGIKWKLHPKLVKAGKYIALSLTWLSLMIIFISRNPSMGNYEPFAAIFEFEGHGLIWYILPLIIFVSLVIRRFWCRFFCPAGIVLDQAAKLRRKVRSGVKNEKG